MKAYVIRTPNATEMAEAVAVLGNSPALKISSSKEVKTLKREVVQAWCIANAVYQVPTLELVEWLRSEISGRTALEICTGFGWLGRTLGITSTDSAMQTLPAIKAHYALLRQPIIDPPSDVIRLEASSAVKKYAPQVVFASWATHKWKEGLKDGSVEGVDEEGILDHPAVESYIMIGNLDTHENKPIMARRHSELHTDWLISRAMDQSKNRIFVWDK